MPQFVGELTCMSLAVCCFVYQQSTPDSTKVQPIHGSARKLQIILIYHGERLAHIVAFGSNFGSRANIIHIQCDGDGIIQNRYPIDQPERDSTKAASRFPCTNASLCLARSNEHAHALSG